MTIDEKFRFLAVSSGNKEFMKQQIKSFDSKIEELKYQLEMEKI